MFGYDTLSQFFTDCAGNFVILRRHEHGRPVFRSESDLQGPNFGGRDSETENSRCKSLFASVPLRIAIPSRTMPEVPKLSRISREYGGWPQRRDGRTSHNQLLNHLRIRSVENRAPTVFTRYLQFRAVCCSLTPANFGFFSPSRQTVRWEVSIF
jgi:hypothetical protein